jgi:CBS domain-containing protein
MDHDASQGARMKVSDLMRVKGDALYTLAPEAPLRQAVALMAEQDIGSVVVMAAGKLAGMLTFREVINRLHENNGALGDAQLRTVMDASPPTVGPDTDVMEVRRLMLDRHVRYLPVMDGYTLAGVISFYDVAKAMLEEQSFENRMLKAYIRDWPEPEEARG